MDRAALERSVEIAREIDRREASRRLFQYFPDVTGIWRGETFHARHLYSRQMEFFEATGRFREVCMMAANRTGKTVGGAYALALWLTGRYPKWWKGRRFTGPVRVWASGKTNETTRDIIQTELFGGIAPGGGGRKFTGTGMVPGETIGDARWKAGVADLIDTIKVKHSSGRWSSLGLKSYQQGRDAFEGTSQHVVWLDEEPPQDIYTECLTRTATTKGLIMSTFTPLDGMSDVAMMFMPSDQRAGAA